MVLYPMSRATYMYVRCNNFINGLIRRKMKTAFCDIILIIDKQLYGNLLINIKIETKVWYYMEYFIHFYHLSFFSLQGKMKYKESVTEGFENTVPAFIGLFSGQNIGKALVKI